MYIHSKFGNAETTVEAIRAGVYVSLEYYGFEPTRRARPEYLDDSTFNKIATYGLVLAKDGVVEGIVEMRAVVSQMHALNYYRLSEKPGAPGWTAPGKGVPVPTPTPFEVPRWAPWAALVGLGLLVFTGKG